MPEEENSMGIAPDKSRTVNHISPVIQYGPKQNIVLMRVVFQVRILNDYIIPGCLPDTGAQGRPFPLIISMREESYIHFRMLIPVILHRLNRVVGGAIIHNNDFFI